MRQSTQETEPEGRLVRFLLAALVALICGVGADVVLVLPYAFSSEPWRMWFAAFGIGALFSALVAGWVGTLIASDRTRSRLLIVVGTSEAAVAF
jgi:threonine/homoserine/homoserine lactone efflux protein